MDKTDLCLFKRFIWHVVQVRILCECTVVVLLQAHNDLLRTYEAKLTQFGIPIEELGFKPLDTTVGGQLLGQGPAGLVSTPS